MRKTIFDIGSRLPEPRSAEPRDFYRTYDCPEPGYRFVATTPATSPTLWRNYLDGALINYRNHGVVEVLEYDRIADGRSTSLFFAAVNANGHVIGGVRAQGPYTSPEQAHAIEEWSGHPGQDVVHAMIAERLPHGVIEIKSAWVADSAVHRHELADCVPRTAVHAAKLLGARFACATSAEHTWKRWTTTGAELAPTLAPVPYPDARYRTGFLWLDRVSVAERADSSQLSRLISESAQLADHRTPRLRRPLAALGAQ